MLGLDIGLIADTYGLIPQVTGKVEGSLVQFFIPGYSIQRLQGFGGIMENIVHKIKIFFQLLEMADLVKGPQGIVGVAEPAITVVPVACAVVEFRQAG